MKRILLLFLTSSLLIFAFCMASFASTEPSDWQKMCGASTLNITPQGTRVTLCEGLSFYKYQKAPVSLHEFSCTMRLFGFEAINGYYAITLTDAIPYANNSSGLFLLMHPQGTNAIRLEGQILHRGVHVTPATTVLSVDLSKPLTLRGRLNSNGTYSLSFDGFETAYTFTPPSNEDFLTSLGGKTYFSFGGCINQSTEAEACMDLYELCGVKTVGATTAPDVEADHGNDDAPDPMASITVDPLGRGIAPAVSNLSTNGNGGKTDVGMWYVTYNSEANWVNNFGSGYPIKYRPLMPDGSYGILDSADTHQIDFHLRQMAAAKVDFIILDLTNGGLTPDISYGWDASKNDGGNAAVMQARLVCQRIALWNETHAWKIKYAVSVGAYPEIANSNRVGALDAAAACYAAEKQAQAVYNSFFENDEYGAENYYQVDGKPLLILFDWTRNMKSVWQQYNGEKTYGERFFVGHADCGTVGSYGWFNGEGTHINEEVTMISPGHDTAGESAPDIARNYGNHYRNSWRTVLSNPLPRMVVISSFNDFNEQTAVFTADSSACRSGVEEVWRDLSGAINHSMYWDMTVEGIRLLRIANGEEEGEFDLSRLDSYLPSGVSFPTDDAANEVPLNHGTFGRILVASAILFVGIFLCLLGRACFKKYKRNF